MLRYIKTVKSLLPHLSLCLIVLLNGCNGCSSGVTVDTTPATRKSTFSEQAIEMLTTNVSSQECGNEKKQHVVDSTSELKQSIDTLFGNLSEKSIPQSEMDKILNFLADKRIEENAAQLALILKSQAGSVDQSIKQIFGDIQPDVSEDLVWKLVQIAQYDEWPYLETKLREIIKNAQTPSAEAIELQAITSRLSFVASQPEGKEIFKLLGSSDLMSIPSELRTWELLQLSLKPEFQSLLKNLKAGLYEWERPSSQTAQIQDMVNRVREFALSEDGQFLHNLLAQDLSDVKYDQDQIIQALRFLQKEDIQSLATRFGKVAAAIRKQVSLSNGSFEFPGLTRSSLDEEMLWKLFVFLQTDQASSLKPLPKEKTELQKQTAQIREKFFSTEGREVRSYLKSKLDDKDAAGEITKWLPALQLAVKVFREPKIAEAIKRIKDFPFTDDGRRVMQYAKRFITEKKIRDHMIRLADVGQKYHGGYLESQFGIKFCLEWRSTCNMAYYWNGLDSQLTNETLDYAALADKNGVLDDFLLLEESFKRITHLLPSEPKTTNSVDKTIAQLGKFFGEGKNLKEEEAREGKERAKMIKLGFELFFDRGGAGEALNALSNLMEQYHERNTKILQDLARETGFEFDDISTKHIDFAIAFLRDESALDLLLFVPDLLSEFEETIRLIKEFRQSLNSPEITRDDFSQFLKLLDDSQHEKAADILLSKAREKETLADSFTFFDFFGQFVERHQDDIRLAALLDQQFGITPAVVAALSQQPNLDLAKKILALNEKYSIAKDLLRLDELATASLADHAKEVHVIDVLRKRLGLNVEDISQKNISDVYKFASDYKNRIALMGLARFLLAAGEYAWTSRALVNNTEFNGNFFTLIRSVKKEHVSSAHTLAKFGLELMSMTSQNGCVISMPHNVSDIPLKERMLEFSVFLTDTKFGLPSWLSLFRNVAKDNNK